MKIVKKIVFVIISILLGLILIYNVYNFISIKVLHKDLASINGYATLEVVSGSMEPTIHIGDIIIINTKDKNYKEKDIITFRGTEGEFVTHRIISIDNNSMITKGDNNDSEDEPINIENIVGKYVNKINGGGKILSSFKNPLTMVMIFIIGLLACVLLSTDKDGKPILESDELEFQEFLKSKNATKEEPKNIKAKKITKEESSKEKEDKVEKTSKNSSHVKKMNTTSVKDTKKIEKKPTNSVKKTSASSKAKKSITPKVEAKTAETKKVSATKKATTKSEATPKKAVKKTVTNNGITKKVASPASPKKSTKTPKKTTTTNKNKKK